MPPDLAPIIRKALPALMLAFLWFWETRHPARKQRHRWPHAGQNLAVALTNALVLAFTVGVGTVAVAEWTAGRGWGLLSRMPLEPLPRLVVALVLLDAWMYVLHRANHELPLLWRFHRMHHSDPAMDVTTATRFHLGEHLISATLRLALIPLVGWEVWHLVVYDTLVIAITQFHHANISLGQWDRLLRLLIVTPDMHKMHHSDHQPETDSNYSTILSVWDRLAGTFAMRSDLSSIVFGLREFRDPAWQRWRGLWKTPFVSVKKEAAEAEDRP